MDDIIGKVGVSVISAIIVAFLSQWGLIKANPGKEPPPRQVYTWRAGALLIGAAVFVLWGRFPPVIAFTTPPGLPVLQSVQAKPNTVPKGGLVTVTVQLDRPAPRGGVSVVLNSSDPAVLTVDGNATVPQGRTMGTAYSKAIEIPTYPSPVTVVASLNEATVQTEVNITDSSAHHSSDLDPSPRPARSAIPVHSPPSNLTSAAIASVPVPLDAQLLDRLEEAEGRLSAEKSYWEGVKQHMPAGTSLRPEINAQLFAAGSTARRCAKAQEASEAASLASCIDALNDHLTQLTIQH